MKITMDYVMEDKLIAWIGGEIDLDKIILELEEWCAAECRKAIEEDRKKR